MRKLLVAITKGFQNISPVQQLVPITNQYGTPNIDIICFTETQTQGILQEKLFVFLL